MPWPPGNEPETDPRLQAIATASRELMAKRDEWLGGADGKKRTLTRLLQRPPRLARPGPPQAGRSRLCRLWLDPGHER